MYLRRSQTQFAIEPALPELFHLTLVPSTMSANAATEVLMFPADQEDPLAGTAVPRLFPPVYLLAHPLGVDQLTVFSVLLDRCQEVGVLCCNILYATLLLLVDWGVCQ
eukprot:COSAG01_NODE_21756_length_886_cov_1.611182_2_plen_108_part_00